MSGTSRRATLGDMNAFDVLTVVFVVVGIPAVVALAVVPAVLDVAMPARRGPEK
jgi:hypothetical protein